MSRTLSTNHPTISSERQALSRDGLKKAGGRIVTIRLTADDVKNLDAIHARIKLTATSAISYALERLARTI